MNHKILSSLALAAYQSSGDGRAEASVLADALDDVDDPRSKDLRAALKRSREGWWEWPGSLCERCCPRCGGPWLGPEWDKRRRCLSSVKLFCLGERGQPFCGWVGDRPLPPLLDPAPDLEAYPVRVRIIALARALHQATRRVTALAIAAALVVELVGRYDQRRWALQNELDGTSRPQKRWPGEWIAVRPCCPHC